MIIGTVKSFNAARGYGFIAPDGGGKDVFVHVSAVEKSGLPGLNAGQSIEFDIEHTRGRPAAANLKVDVGQTAPNLKVDAGQTAPKTGRVKWFNLNKGYGFIAPDDGGKDVFVHVSAVEKSGLAGLSENEPVRFEVVTDRGRPAAANLQSAG